MREVRLSDMEMSLYNRMSEEEQVWVKRGMWMISDAPSDEKAEDLWQMLEALFQGAYIKYEKGGVDDGTHYKYGK